MSAPPISVVAYYRAQPEPYHSTLLELRERILRIIPAAEEVIHYKMPTFLLNGEPICGLMAHTKHIGLYPYSGSVLAQLPDITARFGGTKSALHLPIDKAVPLTVLRALIKAKLRETR